MSLLFVILTFLLIGFIKSFELSSPKCENCKWFLSDIKNDKNLGFCKIFANKISINNQDKLVYNYADHCRDNEFLCGTSGWLFETIVNKIDKKDYVEYFNSKEISEIEKNTLIVIKNELGIKNKYSNKDFTEEKLSDVEKKYYDHYLKKYTKYNMPKKYIF